MKKIKNKIMELIFIIPIPVLIIAVGILNYVVGSVMATVNREYANIGNRDMGEFYYTILRYIIAWTVLHITNAVTWKITNMRILNSNYLKWIKKLTYSKVSSITTVGTGGINNAIHTLSQCDKEMMNCVIRILPLIMPIVILCKEEFKIGGIIPVIINIVYIAVIVTGNLIIANFKSNKIAAKANAEIHSVTTDCIANSKTVKYFGKENWSIDKQYQSQKNNFSKMLNLKKGLSVHSLYSIFQWIPTLINIGICWNSTPTVLFILMSDYCLTNVSDNITNFIDYIGEKKAQMAVIGQLEEDKIIKKPLEKLVIKDVFFKYSPESKVEFRIDDILIERGKRYCITGKSGFGKSTFIKLLTKTVEPNIAGGQIDSVDTIYMFAESEMFNTSVLENISLGDETVTISEVSEILKKLEVVLDLDIENDPVGERGELLSTGQKQRVNLARVIVYARRHPGVLVALDEVTSALDEVTSINCINYLTSEFERLGTTLLYVSNKSDYLNTNLITDNIYVVREGDTVNYIQK